MTNHSQTSCCKVISIASARMQRPHRALALIIAHRVMDLAELASFIGAGSDLSYRITEAACQEFGWPWLSLEESIVLLGREGLYRLLSEPSHPGRSASQLHRVLTINTPTAALRPLQTFQGEPK
jgi:hypothetical protein